MEHSLHLAAKHFVESIAPGFSTEAEDVCADDSEDVDNDDDDDLDAVDSLGKAIALVKQVCFSVPAESTSGLTHATDSQVSPSKSLFPCDLQPSWDHTSRAYFMDPYSMGIPLQVSRAFHLPQSSAFKSLSLSSFISPLIRQSPNLYSLQTQVTTCQISPGTVATQTTIWVEEIGSALEISGMHSGYIRFVTSFVFCSPYLGTIKCPADVLK